MPQHIQKSNYEGIFELYYPQRMDTIKATIESIKANLPHVSGLKLTSQLQTLNNWHELTTLLIIQNMHVGIINDMLYDRNFDYPTWVQTQFEPLIENIDELKEPLIEDAIFVGGGTNAIASYDDANHHIQFDTYATDDFQNEYHELFDNTNFRAPYDQMLPISKYQMFDFDELSINFDKYFQPNNQTVKHQLKDALAVLDEFNFILETIEEYSLNWYTKVTDFKNQDNLKFIQICITHDLISLMNGIKIYEQLVRQYVKQQFNAPTVNRQKAITNLPKFKVQRNWDVRNPTEIEIEYPDHLKKPNAKLNKYELSDLIAQMANLM